MNDSQHVLGLLSVYLPIVEDYFTLCSLAALRFYVAFYIFPPLSDTFITGYMRNGLVTLLALYVATGMPVGAVHELGLLKFAAYAAKEALLGLLIGFASAQVFWIAECVGALVDTHTGYNDVQLKNPLGGEQSTPVSQLLSHTVTAVFFMMGGMLFLLGLVFQSFKAWPLLSALPHLGGEPGAFVIDQVNGLMSGVVKFGAPLILVLVLIDVGFGLVVRSAGKLDISNLGQPVKGAVALLMLALLMATIVPQIRHLLLPEGLLQQLTAALSH